MAMSECLTCTNSTLGSDQVIVINSNREVQNALCKHFWFSEQQYLQSVLCYPCWHKIEDFHRFYCEVRRTQARPLCYQAPIKLEPESHPVGVVLEIPAEQAGDCMVVQNGEIYSKEYDNPQVCVDPETSEQPTECVKAPPTIKRSIKRTRLQKIEKDALQKYVSQNMTLNCDTCSERCDTFDLLQRHSMMAHAKRATVVCCNSKLSDLSRFVKHIQQHLNLDLFRCDHCFQHCSSRNALKKHLRINHNGNDVAVNKEIELSVMRTEVADAGPSGMQKSDASENMNSSGDEDDENDDNSRPKEPDTRISLQLTPAERTQVEMFVEKHRKLDCDLCPERFTQFKDLQKHSVEKHSKRKTGLCCNRKFRDSTYFVAHMLYHINPERFKCTECPRISPSLSALRRHMHWMHKPGGKKKYPCHKCEQTFRTRSAVVRHAERHGEPIPLTDDELIDKSISEYFNLQCNTCQKQHDSYRALQKHSISEHGKLVAVSCCNKKMYRRFELVDHYQYHKDPLTFRCKICAKVWNTSAALKYHMKNKHSGE